MKENISLKEYFEVKLVAMEMALKLARESMEKRLDTMNEFRDTLKDQASKFITRDEINIWTNKLEADIRLLNKSKDLLEGKASATSVYVGWIISAISLIVSAVGIVLKFKG